MHPALHRGTLVVLVFEAPGTIRLRVRLRCIGKTEVLPMQRKQAPIGILKKKNT